MPTYEYQCGTCGNRFEKFQSFSDEPVKICPECGSPVKKVFSPAGIIFKGSGWYVNDSKKATNGASAPSSSSGDKAEKAESAESKPAAETASAGESKPNTETKPSASSKSEAAA
jgi:putative FmdB family regulatory protein